MKKILIAALLLIVLLITPYFLSKKYRETMTRAYCQIRGGRLITGQTNKKFCEIQAKDSGKVCTYDEECSTNFCDYGNPEKCSIVNCPPSAGDNLQGKCATYKSDKAGSFCHRRQGDQLRCEMMFY